MSRLALLIGLGLLAPATLRAQAISEYAAFWSENGSTSFLRLLADSTIVVLRVRYAAYRESTEPSIRFARYRLRCDVEDRKKSGFTLLRVATTETALLQPPTTPGAFVSTGWGSDSEQSSMVFVGCGALRQRQ